ncbi:MAG: hypothetical protein JWQ97_2152 [Phenylobacterium sp.]|nr:hypothetical protein [Phenylobacterium sp.]
MGVGTDGDDVLVGGAGNETLDGGAGNDTASYATAATGVIANLATGVVAYEPKIMPLGDSITYGIGSTTVGGYRGPLWDLLRADGLTVNFVGSNPFASIDDPDNEGHGGWTITDIDGQVGTWIPAAQPDVVLLIIGTNDTSRTPRPTTDVLIGRLSHLIDDIIAAQPGHPPKIFIGPSPVPNDNQPADRIAAIQAYDAAIPDLVAQKRAAGVDITFVDMSDLSPSTDMSLPPDPGVHPNPIGYQKIAEHWYDALLTLGTDSGTLAGGPHDQLVSIENLQGSPYQDVLTGTDGPNMLVGLGGADILDGGGGADTMIGGQGNDYYVVDNPGDQLIELTGEGTDTVRTTFTSYVLPANFENLAFIGVGNFVGTGNELVNVITGGAGNDTLDGGLLNDTLIGGAGDDRLIGGSGLDRMEGGAGNDTYSVDAGYDTAIETLSAADGGGIDTVESTRAWTLGPNFENLTLTGTSSVTATGNELANVLIGNLGNNTLDGAAGADTMMGMAGKDTYVVDNVGDVVSEIDPSTGGDAGGYDTVNTSLPSYTLPQYVEVLTTTNTDPSVGFQGTGNELVNVINGGPGADTLSGGNDSVKDTLNGGAGDDTYTVQVNDVVMEAPGAGHDKVLTALTLYTLPDNVEDLVYTGAAAFKGTGNASDNLIVGGAGNDTLDGGLGADTLQAGAGNDTYMVANAGDVVSEADPNTGADAGGVDTVKTTLGYTLASGSFIENLTSLNTDPNVGFQFVGNELANLITGGAGNDTLSGGLDSLKDTLKGGAGDDTYTVLINDGVVEDPGGGRDRVQTAVDAYTLPANVEELVYTGAGAFRATGSGSDNLIIGGAGNDTIDGGLGADTLQGGGGSDTYLVDNLGDIVSETDPNTGADAGGIDTVKTTLGSYTLTSNVENLTYIGTTGAFVGTGNEIDNSITGGAGNDLLHGATGNDILRGGDGADQLYGDDGADKIYGENGPDTLVGGLGADTLSGGADADLFLFTGAVLNNKDQISDFTQGVDKIGIQASGFDPSLAPGALDPAWFVSGTSATAIGHGQFVYTSATKLLSWDPDGQGGAAAVPIATFSLAVNLQSSDFLLV